MNDAERLKTFEKTEKIILLKLRPKCEEKLKRISELEV
jgi:hypothetical protein